VAFGSIHWNPTDGPKVRSTVRLNLRMSVSDALGERRTAEVPAGTIDYRERGSGPPVVFVHGVGVNGDLWRHVAPRLAQAGHRCIAPDLPFGAHSRPLHEDADMSLPGLARIVADFADALGLEDATIVGNDTGGAVSQWLAGHHPERIARLVLTSCDAFEKFPPAPQLYLKPAARVPGILWLVAWTVRFKAVQRLPTAYGWTTRRPIDPAIMRSYTEPVRTIPGVRRDLRRLLLAVDTRYTFEAAESLRGFDKPALVVWAAGDKLFPLDHGRRLAELLPQGRFETIPDSRTFIPEEQPERLAAMVRDFLGAGLASRPPEIRPG
jgi:pimeloyl-ACP methyl ester carboxylesterase